MRSRFVLIALSLVGLLADLIVIINNSSPPLCSYSLFNCNEVISRYGYVGGLPLSYLALVWFSVALTLSIINFVLRVDKVLLAWGAVGVIPIPYLIYTEILAGTICIYCTIMHIVIVSIFTLSLYISD